MLPNINKYLALPPRERREIANAGRFLTELETYLWSLNENQRKPSGKFSASTIGLATGKSACGNYIIGCQRQLFYKYLNAPGQSSWDPQMRFRLDVGSAIHAVVDRYLEGMGASEYVRFADYKGEVWIPNRKHYTIGFQFNLSGRTDGLYTIDPNRYVLETKSLSSKVFHALRSPKKEHITQAMVYMACFDIPVANILYISLESELPKKEFMVQFEPEHWAAITDKIELVIDHAERGEYPEREGNSFFCATCDFRLLCQPPPR